MSGPRIEGADHVSHLCGGSKCDDDGRPLGVAFLPRETDEYLSVNWLEHTGASCRAQQLKLVRDYLTKKGMNLTKNGRLAVLHLQTLFDHIESETPDSRQLTAHHEPEPLDPSHAGLYGYHADDHLIADLVAEVVHEHYQARG